jgi:hypothetical protein
MLFPGACAPRSPIHAFSPAGDSTGTREPHAKRQSQSTVLAVLGSPGRLILNRQARSGLAA